MEEIYRAAALFYESSPWFLLSSQNVIEMINTQTNESRVLQVCGNSFNDTGLMMWKSLRDFKRIIVPGISQVDAIVKGQVYQTLYWTEQEADDDVKQFFAKNKHLPCPTIGGQRIFADICLLAQRKPTKEELIFMHAGLTLIPIFVNKHMVRESFNNWKPVEKKFNISNGIMNTPTTTYLLRYPAEGKRIPLGECRLGPLPSGVEPIRVESVSEAHAYFLAKVAESEKRLPANLFQSQNLLASAPGGMKHLAYMKGLADTYWKLGETDKAAEIAYKMVWYDPTDRVEVTDMLVDFVLELGRYDEVMPLLTRESLDSPLCLWNSVLVNFVKYGGDHEITQKALVQALKHHPSALSIIIGQRSLPRDMESSVMVQMKYSRETGLQGDFMASAQYCKNFAKYWRNAPGAIEWLKKYGLKMHNKLEEPGGKSNMNSFPKPNLMVCFKCFTHKESGLLKCGQCRRATYCNKECQKAHWKEHKLVCAPYVAEKLP